MDVRCVLLSVLGDLRWSGDVDGGTRWGLPADLRDGVGAQGRASDLQKPSWGRLEDDL